MNQPINQFILIYFLLKIIGSHLCISLLFRQEEYEKI